MKLTTVQNAKQPLINLHHNYTSIGTYYKNLSKAKKTKNDENDTEMVAEVVSGEDLSEKDEDNFYIQMRNNLQIQELLKEVGATSKNSKFRRSVSNINMQRKLTEYKGEMDESHSSNSREKGNINDLTSLFSDDQT